MFSLNCPDEYHWQPVRRTPEGSENHNQHKTLCVSEAPFFLYFIMYFVNYLNRKKTDPYYPAFEIIYATEFIFIIATFCAGVVVISFTTRTTKLHRLIRLRIISGILNDLCFVFSRLLVMHHEYFGTSDYVETIPLIFGTVMKQIFLGYMTTLLSVLALDRWVATKAWAWYESSANSTLLFFLLQETILFSISSSIGILLLHQYITSMHAIYCFAVLVVVGAPLLTLVYRHNREEVRVLKQGAVVHRYSISRTYQIKENVWLLSAFKKLARPLVIVCIPPFIFSPIYQRVPPNIGYDGLRFFSASMYDLWLSLASFVVIITLPYYLPQLKNSRNARSIQVAPAFVMKIEKNTPETGDAYFAMLSNDLRREPRQQQRS